MNPQDIQDLKQLIEFLKEYQVAEFDLTGRSESRLKFNQPEATAAGLPELARLLASLKRRSSFGGGRCAAGYVSPAAPAVDPDAGLHMVKSPIVGTFYGSALRARRRLLPPGSMWRRAR